MKTMFFQFLPPSLLMREWLKKFPHESRQYNYKVIVIMSLLLCLQTDDFSQ